MKRFIYASLVLGAFAVQAHADSQSDFCLTHPGEPKCIGSGPVTPPPPPGVAPGKDSPTPPPLPPYVDTSTTPHRPHHHFNHQFGGGTYGDNGFGNYDPFWQRRHRPGFYFEYRAQPSYPVYQYANRCDSIASSLRRAGFRQVRAVDCTGRTYVFAAYRDGEKLRISVNSRNGRIIHIKPAYY